MRRTLGFALLLLASATLSAAQTTPTTRLIPYAGIAADAAGSPLSGPVTITFELYEDQDGGAPLWREAQDVQTDERGRYLVYLGAVTPVPQIAFSEERARWLAVTLDGGRALPRVMLVAVPYALRAADADRLGGQPASSFVRSRPDGRLETSAGVVAAEPLVDGTGVPGQVAKWSSPTTLSSSVISESGTNRIGVGLPDPTGGGVVDSVFTIRNFDNNTGFAVLNQTQQRRFALNTQADGSWRMFDGVNGSWNLGLRQAAGRIGIGTNPIAAFEVLQTGTAEAGVFALSNLGSAQEALVARTNGTGPGVHVESTNAAGIAGRFRVPNAASSLILGQQSFVDVFRVNGAGAVFALAYNTGGADFAEAVEAVAGVEAYEPGDVMVVAAGRDRSVDRASKPYARTVIGIYSTKPGIVASPYPVDDPRREGKLPLAMIGIVPCKVSTENGAIRRGDLLVTSSTPGHAMRGNDFARMTGAIVGKALEPLATGKGTILVAVTLQ